MTAVMTDALRNKVKSMDAMPSIPATLSPLLRALEVPAEDIEMDTVTELIAQDESIVAQCLRVANSALFGGRGDIRSIKGAVAAIGIRRLKDILWTSCLMQLAPHGAWSINPSAFWEHSFGVALVSQQLARRALMPEPESAYLCGLLHDIGEIVMSTVAPKEFEEVAKFAMREGIGLVEAERQVLGFTHCETGKMLAENWTLPEEVRRVIEFHHTPELAPAPSTLPALINLGDWLCRLRGMGYGYDEVCEIDFSEAPAWSILRKYLPRLDEVDMARFTLELDADADQIRMFVAATFRS